jgi:hypothetical protein
MKRIRMIGLALVAVFAMSVVASSVASAAQPVFYTKAAVGTTAANVPFTGVVGAALLEGKGGVKIKCVDIGSQASGEVTGATETENNVTKFTECTTSELPCKSTGQAEGIIVTNVLKGVLGNVTATIPGMRLYSQSGGKGAELAAFSCAGGAIPVVVKGSVIGSLSGGSGTTPAAGKFAASDKLVFAETKGVQKYTKFLSGEGEAGTEQEQVSTSGGPYELSGQIASATLKSVPASNLGFTL